MREGKGDRIGKRRGRSTYELGVEFREAWLAGIIEDEDGVDHFGRLSGENGVLGFIAVVVIVGAVGEEVMVERKIGGFLWRGEAKVCDTGCWIIRVLFCSHVCSLFILLVRIEGRF